MDIDLVIFLAVLAFVLAGWIYVASSFGFVDTFDSGGFTIRTLLRTRRSIPWASLEASVQQFTAFPPHLVVRLQRSRFLQVSPTTFLVFLRQRALDREFLSEVAARSELAVVNRLHDLLK